MLPALLVWLATVALLSFVIVRETERRKKAVTASSIKESLDHLQTGLCFSRPNGLVILTNHRMNELSHALWGKALNNANLFWAFLTDGEPAAGLERIAAGDYPQFRLPDGTIWSFRREMLDGVIQLSAAETTQQHHLISALQEKNAQLEEMNARIRRYGDEVDAYVIARERLDIRVSLHSFLGQSLLTTRHYLQSHAEDPQKILDIWQRNIDVLRMEAEPQPEPDSFDSLKNAAAAIGMQVHLQGNFPSDKHLRKLIAAIGAETLTNAVRHAGARQLWITAGEDEHCCVIRYTNDGAVPQSPVREGGGLSAARKKAEAAGGSMRILSSPRFTLILTFGKEVMTDV